MTTPLDSPGTRKPVCLFSLAELPLAIEPSCSRNPCESLNPAVDSITLALRPMLNPTPLFAVELHERTSAATPVSNPLALFRAATELTIRDASPTPNPRLLSLAVQEVTVAPVPTTTPSLPFPDASEVSIVLSDPRAKPSLALSIALLPETLPLSEPPMPEPPFPLAVQFVTVAFVPTMNPLPPLVLDEIESRDAPVVEPMSMPSPGQSLMVPLKMVTLSMGPLERIPSPVEPGLPRRENPARSIVTLLVVMVIPPDPSRSAPR